MRKISSPPRLDPSTAQFVASRYTDSDILAPRIWCKKLYKTTFSKRKLSNAAKESKDKVLTENMHVFIFVPYCTFSLTVFLYCQFINSGRYC